MNNAIEKYHVITLTAGIELGILAADGEELEHSATLTQVAAAAEFSSDHYGAALAHARSMDAERWVIDESGDTQFVGARAECARVIADAAAQRAS